MIEGGLIIEGAIQYGSFPAGAERGFFYAFWAQGSSRSRRIDDNNLFL
jgi:hypothetical protein